MRVTTALSRLLRLSGVWVRKVRFEPDKVVVEVALKRRRLVCPECGYSTAARKDTRPEDSVWRHLDLGVWRLEVRCRRRRLWCPRHGARTEGVPFARSGSEFTRDFECLLAWLATRTDKSTIKRMLRVDWDTVGRIIKRVCDEELDPDRLNGLFDIGIDEVSWKKQHNYLTLVADHERRQVVWGCEGKGQAAADEFFDELDPPPPPAAPERPRQPRQAPEPAMMVPFGPGSTVEADHGIPGAWLQDGSELAPAIFARASRLHAVSMDMTGGYAKSVRQNAPQATICIDPYHVVQLANQGSMEMRATWSYIDLIWRSSSVTWCAPNAFVDAAMYERGASAAWAGRRRTGLMPPHRRQQAGSRHAWTGLPDHDGCCAAGTGQPPRRLQRLTRRGQ